VSLEQAPVLLAQGLRKSSGGQVLFDGVDLAVAAGEVVAVLGESGVGKSTLLNTLAALEPLDAGTVAVAGTSISALDEDAAARWRRQYVGFVFQAFHVLPHLSVADNVALPLLLGRPDAARVEHLLARVGLAGFAPRAPRTLSGGQLQRVALARALVHRPTLVLADEPTGNLDPSTGARVMEVLMSEVRAQGAALVLVTHSPAAAAQADRVLRLNPNGLTQA
jgi:putative ABC transport system ATP-binding protein